MLGVVACRPQGVFRTVTAHSTPGASFLGIPEPVTLPALAANPFLYQNKFIRVSGLYLPPETFTSCVRNVRGPAGRWFLSGEDWQLEVSGYERVAPRLQPGTPMTIDGIFTFYEGPLGCGKGAARDKLWYLKVIHIEDPNPLPLIALDGGVVEFANGLPGVVMSGTLTATSPVTEATEGSGTPSEPEPTGVTLTPTPAATTPTATIPAGTLPAGATTTGTPPTETATPAPTATPTMTPTPSPTNSGPAETPAVTPTPVVTPPVTPTPGGGYPPPPPPYPS